MLNGFGRVNYQNQLKLDSIFVDSDIQGFGYITDAKNNQLKVCNFQGILNQEELQAREIKSVEDCHKMIFLNLNNRMGLE